MGGKDCCCTPDDNAGFDLLGCVLCGRQCGTGGCCLEDKDKQCFACIICECQFDCVFPFQLIAAMASCVVCCASKALITYGIPMTATGLAATGTAASTVGVVTSQAVGGLFGCCTQGTCTACIFLTAFPFCYAPCYYADNAALIDGVTNTTSWSIDCASFCCFSMCCCGWIVSSTKRSEMRYALGLEEESPCPLVPSVCADECAHFWCLPCTLVEERKILQQNGCTRAKPAVLFHKDIMEGKDPKPEKVEYSVEGSVEQGGAPVTSQPF